MSRARWGLAVLAGVGALVVLVGLAFAWVAIYAYAIHPGEDAAFYERYAQVASPWVAVVAGLPVFFALTAVLLRASPGSGLATAFAAWLVHFALSLAITGAAGALPELLPMELASHTGKALGVLAAARLYRSRQSSPRSSSRRMAA